MTTEVHQTVTIGAGGLGTTSASKDERFWFHLDDLLRFMYPENLQHPLAASRLFIFGLYGPLDAQGQLRSGIRGAHVLSDYELEAMCEQIEREDVVRVYVPKGKGIGMLLNHEQEALISQADAKLKIAKGKAMLKAITRNDVIGLFQVWLVIAVFIACNKYALLFD
jgi:hypothetical protein